MKAPVLNAQHFLTVTDLTRDEILELFEFSSHLKARRREGKTDRYLKGKTLGMIFEKSSTRTRVSFEAGIIQLGGHALFLSRNDIQIGRGETISDTAKVLSRYLDGIMIRTFAHQTVVDLAASSRVPVINGLSDSFHPCQALTDYFTVYEHRRDLSSVKLAFVGDGNNVANSLLLGAGLLGVNCSVASPKGFLPDPEVVKQAKMLAAETGVAIEVTESIDAAVKNADFLYTDVWVSMGSEKETAKRAKALSKYRITRQLIDRCAPGCMVMHCLPAHRGEEITDEAMDCQQSIVFDQAENRLHFQKALMCSLMGGKKGAFPWI